MSKAWILALALALVVLLLPGVPAGQAPGWEYKLYIDCPDSQGIYVSSSGATGGCPIRAVDAGDMMGDPSLAVDPMEPKDIIMGSLHGCVDDGGPSQKSRSSFTSCAGGTRSPFTTFTSDDGGNFWDDKPYCSPDEDQSAYGEHVQVTTDPYGHVFVGSVYAYPSDGWFDYELALQKFESIESIRENQGSFGGCSSDYNSEWVTTVYEGNVIRGIWFVFNPETDHMTMVWNEVTDDRAENETVPPPRCFLDLPPPVPCIPPPSAGLGDHVARAKARHPGERVAGSVPPADAVPKGAIGVAWTDSKVGSEYTPQLFNETIQPCRSSTNPVLSDGWIYVGCVADPEEGEFPWNPTTIPGAIELFRMHPDAGKPEYLGTAPVSGGSPRLGVRTDGRLALVTARADSGDLGLDVAFGTYDEVAQRITWTERRAYGPDIIPHVPGVTILRANVQDLIYREQSGAIHLILRTTVEPSGVGVDSSKALVLPRIRKAIVALDEEHGLLATLPLDIGNLVNRTDSALLGVPEMAFEDATDDFLQLPPTNHTYRGRNLGNDYAREFFAVGDYGTVQFAELIEVTDIKAPALVLPPPPPVPVPAAASSAALNLAPVAGISLAAVLGLSFVAARKKNPAAAIARMKK